MKRDRGRQVHALRLALWLACWLFVIAFYWALWRFVV